jgi:hypothetical protein
LTSLGSFGAVTFFSAVDFLAFSTLAVVFLVALFFGLSVLVSDGSRL